MRFLHVADAHLDTSFPGRTAEVRDRLREASREAFRRATDLAIREEVHAVLIAGDLFDGDRLSFQTERFLLEQLARLGDHDIIVVYATGNHDPGSASSTSRPLPWPENVRVVGDARPQRIEIPGADHTPAGYVTASGHAEAREDRDLSRMFPPPIRTLPEVALLHTQVHAAAGSEAHHVYAPSDLSYLTRAGYDYWALGHVHVSQALSVDPPVWYAGCLQGRTHADQGDRGALLVDLADRDAPAVEFRPLAPIRWETVDVGGLEEATSLDDLERRTQLAWDNVRGADGGGGGTEWMLRVRLTGPCPLWSELGREEDRKTLATELQAILGVLDVVVVTDEVHPVIPLDEHRNRTDVLGEALRLAASVRRMDTEISGLKQSDLSGAVAGDDRALAGYVRDLLEGADGEIAARLLHVDAHDS